MERIALYGLAYSPYASWPGNPSPPLKLQRAQSLTPSVPLATTSTSSRTFGSKGETSMPPWELSHARRTDGHRDRSRAGPRNCPTR